MSLKGRKGGKCAYMEGGRESERGVVLVGTACRRRWALEMADAGGLYRQDSLSGAGNEVSVVIKRKVSMTMQSAVCTENLLEWRGLRESRISKKFSSISSPSAATPLLFHSTLSSLIICFHSHTVEAARGINQVIDRSVTNVYRVAVLLSEITDVKI